MWTIDFPSDHARVAQSLERGLVLALEIDPRAPLVCLDVRQPGLGSALVGQRVVFRQWLGASGEEPVSVEELEQVLGAATQWLHGPAAARCLDTISSGYRCTRLWSGDELGDWSRPAWSAAQAIAAGVIAAMEAADEA
jgi:hypothetical protein